MCQGPEEGPTPAGSRSRKEASLMEWSERERAGCKQGCGPDRTGFVGCGQEAGFNPRGNGSLGGMTPSGQGPELVFVQLRSHNVIPLPRSRQIHVPSTQHRLRDLDPSSPPPFFFSFLHPWLQPQPCPMHSSQSQLGTFVPAAPSSWNALPYLSLPAELMLTLAEPTPSSRTWST